ncbi:uncharacterized protein [Haliotis asinina]|uniref:uncharacterized protein n=1 Tax=Haliotis asinina TaxID=109174 RepID=UPI0035325584
MELHSNVDFVGLICVLLVWTTTNADEGLLLLARSGGRYDPLQLWFSSSRDLWAVNQCVMDEKDSFRNHSIKGNFRSPTIDNLTSYRNVELELVLYNLFGDELLNVKGCKMVNDSRTLHCDDQTFGNVTGRQLDRMGGFVLTTENERKMLTMMYDSTYYFDHTPTRERILLPTPGNNVQPPKTGYKGCFDLEPSPRRDGKCTSVELCLRYIRTSHVSIWNSQYDSSWKPEDKHPLDDRKCSSLCTGNTNQTCGGYNVTSVYDVKDYWMFKKFTERAFTGTKEIAKQTVNDSHSSTMVALQRPSYISHMKVCEDEECSLTNTYFNVSGPEYNVVFYEDCNGIRNISRTVHGREAAWQVGSILTSCVTIEPIPHNCTLHRATFVFFGSSGTDSIYAGVVDVGRSYIGIRGTWSNEEPTTTMTTTTTTTTTTETPVVTTEDTTISLISTAQTRSEPDSTVDDRTTSPPQHDSSTLVPDRMTSHPNSFTTSGSQEETTPDVTRPVTTDSTPDTTSTTGSTTTETPASTTFNDLDDNATSPAPAMTKACTCLCKSKPLKKNQTKVMAAKEKAIKIQKELKVDTMNLSSSVRRKVSAPDSRTTAAVGGYLGICLLTIALGSLILADITSITRHIQLLRRNIRGPPAVKKTK